MHSCDVFTVVIDIDKLSSSQQNLSLRCSIFPECQLFISIFFLKKKCLQAVHDLTSKSLDSSLGLQWCVSLGGTIIWKGIIINSVIEYNCLSCRLSPLNPFESCLSNLDSKVDKSLETSLIELSNQSSTCSLFRDHLSCRAGNINSKCTWSLLWDFNPGIFIFSKKQNNVNASGVNLFISSIELLRQ